MNRPPAPSARDAGSHLRHRTIQLPERRTTVRIDDATWAALKKIAEREKTALKDVVAEVDRSRGDVPLSTAIRALVLQWGEPAPHPMAFLQAAASRYPKHIRHETTAIVPAGAERKILFALAGMPDVEAEAKTLPERWSQWLASSVDGSLPDHREFFHRFLADGATDFNVVDVSASDPYNYCVEKVHHLSPKFSGLDLASRRIGEHPLPLQAEGLQDDFSLAKREAVPLYQILQQRLRGVERTYSRLILPFSTNGKTVDRLITFIRGTIYIPATFDEAARQPRAQRTSSGTASPNHSTIANLDEVIERSMTARSLAGTVDFGGSSEQRHS